MRDWTPEELRDLALARPGMTGTLPDGSIVPLVTREEYAQLAARYPTMELLSGKASQQSLTEASQEDPARDAELARRYPTMLRKK